MKRFTYFIVVLVAYLITGYLIECVEVRGLVNFATVMTGKKIVEAVIFSIIMTVVWMFSPKEKSAEKKEN